MDSDDILAKTILNPTAQNVNNCNNENDETSKKLYDKIINDGNAGNYSYADGSYIGNMSSDELNNILNQVIKDNLITTTTRDITVEESKNRKIYLTNIDKTKEFKLDIGNMHYLTYGDAKNDGYIVENGKEIYIDLRKTPKEININVEYHVK